MERTRGQAITCPEHRLAPLSKVLVPNGLLPYHTLLCVIHVSATHAATGSPTHVSAALPALTYHRLPRLASSAIILLDVRIATRPASTHTQRRSPASTSSCTFRYFSGRRVPAPEPYIQYARSAATGPREWQNGVAKGPLPRCLWSKLQIKFGTELPRAVARRVPQPQSRRRRLP
jgi:hypothetical protein